MCGRFTQYLSWAEIVSPGVNRSGVHDDDSVLVDPG